MHKLTLGYSDTLAALDRFETTVRPHFHLPDDIALTAVDGHAI